MSTDSGGQSGSPGRDQEEKWLEEHASQTRDGQEYGSGRKQDQNPPTSGVTARNKHDGQVNGGKSKRTWRETLQDSPVDGGPKKSKTCLNDSRHTKGGFVTVESLRATFQGARNTEMIGFHCLSVAFEPLRHLNHGATVQCNTCKHAHDFGSAAFKPFFEQGLAIFDLHCQHCNTVTANEQMAEAAVKLLANLSEEDQRFLGLSIEEVSETDELEMSINEPMQWLGRSAVEGPERTQHQNPYEVIASRSPSEEERVLQQLQATADMPSNEELVTLLKSLITQLNRVEGRVTATDKKVAELDSRQARRATSNRAAASSRTGREEAESQVRMLREERDLLRRQLTFARSDQRERTAAPALQNAEAAANDREKVSKWTTLPVDEDGAQRLADEVLNKRASEAGVVGSPMGSDNGQAERNTRATQAPTRHWVMAVKGGMHKQRNTLHPDLVARLDAAESKMAAFRRSAEEQPQPGRIDKKRSVEALYFKNCKRGNAREFRFLIQDLVCPEDKEAILFVDFLGANVVEVLVDIQYKDETIAALRQYRFRYMPKATPLADLLREARPVSKLSGF